MDERLLLVEDDASIREIVSIGLKAAGFRVATAVDGRDGLARFRADGFDAVITSGGTGVTPTDQTPDLTRELLDYEVPGIAEALRAISRDTVPTSVLSRGLAGVAGRTLIVNLPGSTGGARDGLAVLGPILGHAVDQLRGGDH